MQVDNASPMQKKTFGLALSIILTLRMPQVLDKLDQILRYMLAQSNINNWIYVSIYVSMLIVFLETVHAPV